MDVGFELSCEQAPAESGRGRGTGMNAAALLTGGCYVRKPGPVPVAGLD